jgi:putative salt-induced outer membrane protein
MKNTLLALALFSFSTSSYAIVDWTSSDELSVLQTGGNTSTKSYGLKSKNKLVPQSFKKLAFDLDFSYMLSKSNDTINEEKWDVKASHERKLNKKYGLQIAEYIEANRFAGIRRRYNTDLGLKYTISEKKERKFFVEGGYRYTIEETTSPDSEETKSSKGRLFTSYQQQVNENLVAGMTAEYIPNFDINEDYIINLEPALTTKMTKTFSLKVSYKWSYDNQPVGDNTKRDYVLTTGVLATF